MFVPHNHRLQLPSILTPRTQRTKKSAEVQLNRIKTYQNSCTATGSGFYSILYHFPTFAWFGLNNTHWLIKTIPRWDLESAHSHQEQTSGNKHTSFASEWQVNTKKARILNNVWIVKHRDTFKYMDIGCAHKQPLLLVQGVSYKTEILILETSSSERLKWFLRGMEFYVPSYCNSKERVQDLG